MRRPQGSLAAVMTFAVTLTGAGVALAGDDANQPLPEDRKARLLERFGAEGIDANGDGILTRAEVRAFFTEHLPADALGRHGPRAMKPGGPGGMKGLRHEGPMGPIGTALRRLEELSADSAPPEFDVARFPRADLDQDGTLSDSEWAAFAKQARERILARLASRFPGADADGDGSINEGELETIKAQVRERCLAKNPDADTDGDGVLSANEFEAFHAARAEQRRARMLERHPEADLDRDGVLSDEEARAARGQRRGHRGKPGTRPGGRHGPWGPMMGGPPPDRILQRHPEADLDGDGALSESELEAFQVSHRARFLERHPEADLDGDGTLSDEEMETFHRNAGPRGFRKGKCPQQQEPSGD